MADLGSFTLTCSCGDNGGSMERIGLYPPGSGTVSSSFFFTKNTPSGRTQLTSLVGVENDANTNNITIASTSGYPYGIPIADDSPSVNESWSDGSGNTSTVTSIGGTMMLANNSQVINIAADQITGNFSPITWSFAKGVGITQIGIGAQSTTISSFYVNTATSSSVGKQANTKSTPVAVGHIGAINPGAQLARILH